MKPAGSSLIFLLFSLIGFTKNENVIEGFPVESMPDFGGKLDKFLEKHIQYPILALKDSNDGKVFVSFWINSLGNTSNHILILGT